MARKKGREMHEWEKRVVDEQESSEWMKRREKRAVDE